MKMSKRTESLGDSVCIVDFLAVRRRSMKTMKRREHPDEVSPPQCFDCPKNLGMTISACSGSLAQIGNPLLQNGIVIKSMETSKPRERQGEIGLPGRLIGL